MIAVTGALNKPTGKHSEVDIEPCVIYVVLIVVGW